MKKIILYIAASLDQRIAEPDGSLDWLTEFPNPQKIDYGYKDLLVSVDTIIMGGKTYRELLSMDVIWPYTNQHTYVVSHHEWSERENVSFITENIIGRIKTLRNETGKDIWLVGGGELVSMLLASDLLDEIRITYFPVILGRGISLFPEQPKESKWKLSGSKSYGNGVLSVIYQKE
ncbi:dihydrofolate reductase family protein [Parabacteroides sp. PF5-6]|uniref:dihydrofolate reductase family protein n=1 Tax=Parabacteroides sp. PF5-6 TaxID=1742403 RepID=UPI002404C889|nr:dihydrofolate reductase family protein [Parabacteroides sp. PF5-6]MDF9830686.1 dihydrofolate reductase [Parabacteroides sp. PF5-6]